MKKPQKLRPHDRVGIVAPSQSAKAALVERGVRTIRALGLSPVVYTSCLLIDDTIDVDPKNKAEDINDAFLDESIRAVIALRAGSGALSILPHVNYDLIREHPKIFVGFSDVTALHLAIGKLAGVVSFYGPVATKNLFVEGAQGWVVDRYTDLSLRSALFHPVAIGRFCNPEGHEVGSICPGLARGKLIGGNLTLLTKSLGTQYEIDTNGCILFMEDFGESLVALASMFRQLEVAGKFADCTGIALGTWVECGTEYTDPTDREKKLESMISGLLRPYRKPVITNLRAGHCMPMATLPLGVKVELNADKNELTFLESATSE